MCNRYSSESYCWPLMTEIHTEGGKTLSKLRTKLGLGHAYAFVITTG